MLHVESGRLAPPPPPLRAAGIECLPAAYPDYVDHAAWTDEWVLFRQGKQGHGPSGNAKEKRAKGGAKKKFTTQLYRMLEAVDGTEHSLAVRWLPHGRAFAVLDKARFVQQVLSQYFPSQKEYKSFQRQLNIYGFLRLTRQDDAYYHECFLRGRFQLAVSIPRPVFARNATRRSLDPASEPDLYAMTWLPDIERPSLPPLDDKSTVADSESASPQIRVGHSLAPSSQMPRPDRNVLVSTMTQAPIRDGRKRTMAQVCDLTATTNAMDASSNQVGMSKFKFSQGDSLPTACDLNITAPHHLYENKPVDVLPAVAPPTLAQLASFSSNRDGRLFQDAAAAAATVAGPPKSDSVGTASRMHRHVISSSTVAREDSDMETISPDTSNETRAAKLQDWADFLHDVDLDTSDDDT